MLFLASTLSGCFGGDDMVPEEPDSVFDTPILMELPEMCGIILQTRLMP